MPNVATLSRLRIVVIGHSSHPDPTCTISLDGVVISHSHNVAAATILVNEIAALLETGATVDAHAYGSETWIPGTAPGESPTSGDEELGSTPVGPINISPLSLECTGRVVGIRTDGTPCAMIEMLLAGIQPHALAWLLEQVRNLGPVTVSLRRKDQRAPPAVPPRPQPLPAREEP